MAEYILYSRAGYQDEVRKRIRAFFQTLGDDLRPKRKKPAASQSLADAQTLKSESESAAQIAAQESLTNMCLWLVQLFVYSYSRAIFCSDEAPSLFNKRKRNKSITQNALSSLENFVDEHTENVRHAQHVHAVRTGQHVVNGMGGIPSGGNSPNHSPNRANGNGAKNGTSGILSRTSGNPNRNGDQFGRPNMNFENVMLTKFLQEKGVSMDEITALCKQKSRKPLQQSNLDGFLKSVRSVRLPKNNVTLVAAPQLPPNARAKYSDPLYREMPDPQNDENYDKYGIKKMEGQLFTCLPVNPQCKNLVHTIKKSFKPNIGGRKVGDSAHLSPTMRESRVVRSDGTSPMGSASPTHSTRFPVGLAIPAGMGTPSLPGEVGGSSQVGGVTGSRVGGPGGGGSSRATTRPNNRKTVDAGYLAFRQAEKDATDKEYENLTGNKAEQSVGLPQEILKDLGFDDCEDFRACKKQMGEKELGVKRPDASAPAGEGQHEKQHHGANFRHGNQQHGVNFQIENGSMPNGGNMANHEGNEANGGNQGGNQTGLNMQGLSEIMSLPLFQYLREKQDQIVFGLSNLEDKINRYNRTQHEQRTEKFSSDRFNRRAALVRGGGHKHRKFTRHGIYGGEGEVSALGGHARCEAQSLLPCHRHRYPQEEDTVRETLGGKSCYIELDKQGEMFETGSAAGLWRKKHARQKNQIDLLHTKVTTQKTLTTAERVLAESMGLFKCDGAPKAAVEISQKSSPFFGLSFASGKLFAGEALSPRLRGAEKLLQIQAPVEQLSDIALYRDLYCWMIDTRSRMLCTGWFERAQAVDNIIDELGSVLAYTEAGNPSQLKGSNLGGGSNKSSAPPSANVSGAANSASGAAPTNQVPGHPPSPLSQQGNSSENPPKAHLQQHSSNMVTYYLENMLLGLAKEYSQLVWMVLNLWKVGNSKTSADRRVRRVNYQQTNTMILQEISNVVIGTLGSVIQVSTIEEEVKRGDDTPRKVQDFVKKLQEDERHHARIVSAKVMQACMDNNDDNNGGLPGIGNPLASSPPSAGFGSATTGGTGSSATGAVGIGSGEGNPNAEEVFADQEALEERRKQRLMENELVIAYFKQSKVQTEIRMQISSLFRFDDFNAERRQFLHGLYLQDQIVETLRRFENEKNIGQENQEKKPEEVVVTTTKKEDKIDHVKRLERKLGGLDENNEKEEQKREAEAAIAAGKEQREGRRRGVVKEVPGPGGPGGAAAGGEKTAKDDKPGKDAEANKEGNKIKEDGEKGGKDGDQGKDEPEKDSPAENPQLAQILLAQSLAQTAQQNQQQEETTFDSTAKRMKKALDQAKKGLAKCGDMAARIIRVSEATKSNVTQKSNKVKIPHIVDRSPLLSLILPSDKEKTKNLSRLIKLRNQLEFQKTEYEKNIKMQIDFIQSGLQTYQEYSKYEQAVLQKQWDEYRDEHIRYMEGLYDGDDHGKKGRVGFAINEDLPTSRPCSSQSGKSPRSHSTRTSMRQSRVGLGRQSRRGGRESRVIDRQTRIQIRQTRMMDQYNRVGVMEYVGDTQGVGRVKSLGRLTTNVAKLNDWNVGSVQISPATLLAIENLHLSDTDRVAAIQRITTAVDRMTAGGLIPPSALLSDDLGVSIDGPATEPLRRPQKTTMISRQTLVQNAADVGLDETIMRMLNEATVTFQPMARRGEKNTYSTSRATRYARNANVTITERVEVVDDRCCTHDFKRLFQRKDFLALMDPDDEELLNQMLVAPDRATLLQTGKFDPLLLWLASAKPELLRESVLEDMAYDDGLGTSAISAVVDEYTWQAPFDCVALANTICVVNRPASREYLQSLAQYSELGGKSPHTQVTGGIITTMASINASRTSNKPGTPGAKSGRQLTLGNSNASLGNAAFSPTSQFNPIPVSPHDATRNQLSMAFSANPRLTPASVPVFGKGFGLGIGMERDTIIGGPMMPGAGMMTPGGMLGITPMGGNRPPAPPRGSDMFAGVSIYNTSIRGSPSMFGNESMYGGNGSMYGGGDGNQSMYSSVNQSMSMFGSATGQMGQTGGSPSPRMVSFSAGSFRVGPQTNVGRGSTIGGVARTSSGADCAGKLSTFGRKTEKFGKTEQLDAIIESTPLGASIGQTDRMEVPKIDSTLNVPGTIPSSPIGSLIGSTGAAIGGIGATGAAIIGAALGGSASADATSNPGSQPTTAAAAAVNASLGQIQIAGMAIGVAPSPSKSLLKKSTVGGSFGVQSAFASAPIIQDDNIDRVDERVIIRDADGQILFDISAEEFCSSTESYKIRRITLDPMRELYCIKMEVKETRTTPSRAGAQGQRHQNAGQGAVSALNPITEKDEESGRGKAPSRPSIGLGANAGTGSAAIGSIEIGSAKMRGSKLNPFGGTQKMGKQDLEKLNDEPSEEGQGRAAQERKFSGKSQPNQQVPLSEQSQQPTEQVAVRDKVNGNQLTVSDAATIQPPVEQNKIFKVFPEKMRLGNTGYVSNFTESAAAPSECLANSRRPGNGNEDESRIDAMSPTIQSNFVQGSSSDHPDSSRHSTPADGDGKSDAKSPKSTAGESAGDGKKEGETQKENELVISQKDNGNLGKSMPKVGTSQASNLGVSSPKSARLVDEDGNEISNGEDSNVTLRLDANGNLIGAMLALSGNALVASDRTISGIGGASIATGAMNPLGISVASTVPVSNADDGKVIIGTHYFLAERQAVVVQASGKHMIKSMLSFINPEEEELDDLESFFTTDAFSMTDAGIAIPFESMLDLFYRLRDSNGTNLDEELFQREELLEKQQELVHERELEEARRAERKRKSMRYAPSSESIYDSIYKIDRRSTIDLDLSAFNREFDELDSALNKSSRGESRGDKADPEASVNVKSITKSRSGGDNDAGLNSGSMDATKLLESQLKDRRSGQNYEVEHDSSTQMKSSVKELGTEKSIGPRLEDTGELIDAFGMDSQGSPPKDSMADALALLDT